MGRQFLSSTIVALTLSFPGTVLAATLEVVVVGLASDDGDVHIALYDSPDAFPESDGMLAETEVPARNRRARAVYRDLKPGRFAVAVYHDENGNHDFDQGFLGIPLEDYGFSNGATVFFAPPSFDAAAFQVSAPETRIVIDLGN
ncbi:MAG: DUF2141 domain-containing protein [Rhodospirillales bacterium]|nr:DUF2141 domain-containing protein [Rhodospirillales bacterium]MBO6788166.1 DUF2141 domain-containing protein [Rhodospirillales bacterium]